MTTGANVLRFFSASYHRFCGKIAAVAIAIFLLILAYFIINFVRK